MVATGILVEVLHVVTATGTISGSTYIFKQLLELLLVVLTYNDSYWDS